MSSPAITIRCYWAQQDPSVPQSSGPVGCSSGLSLASLSRVGVRYNGAGGTERALSRETNSYNWSSRPSLGWAPFPAAGEAGPGSTGSSVLGRHSALCALPVAPATHLSLLSSIKSSASEKFSTWSPLGSGCTERRRDGGSAPMLLLNHKLLSRQMN